MSTVNGIVPISSSPTPPPSLPASTNRQKWVMKTIRRIFPPISGRSLLRHYVPLSGEKNEKQKEIKIFHFPKNLFYTVYKFLNPNSFSFQKQKKKKRKKKENLKFLGAICHSTFTMHVFAPSIFSRQIKLI